MITVMPPLGFVTLVTGIPLTVKSFNRTFPAVGMICDSFLGVASYSPAYIGYSSEVTEQAFEIFMVGLSKFEIFML